MNQTRRWQKNHLQEEWLQTKKNAIHSIATCLRQYNRCIIGIDEMDTSKGKSVRKQTLARTQVIRLYWIFDQNPITFATNLSCWKVERNNVLNFNFFLPLVISFKLKRYFRKKYPCNRRPVQSMQQQEQSAFKVVTIQTVATAISHRSTNVFGVKLFGKPEPKL